MLCSAMLCCSAYLKNMPTNQFHFEILRLNPFSKISHFRQADDSVLKWTFGSHSFTLNVQCWNCESCQSQPNINYHTDKIPSHIWPKISGCGGASFQFLISHLWNFICLLFICISFIHMMKSFEIDKKPEKIIPFLFVRINIKK